MATLAGCIGISGGREPKQRTFEFTITGRNTITASIDPEGEAAGVVRIYVGDDVTFVFVNDRAGKVGVHNHITGETLRIEAAGRRSSTFSVDEDMVGRHVIHCFPIDEGEPVSHGKVTLATVEVRPQ